MESVALLEQEEKEQPLVKESFWKRHLAVILAASGVVAFLFFSTLTFSLVEDWSVETALYFSIVVLTTVGYGGIVPKTVGGRVATIFFVFLDLALILVALGVLAEALLEKQHAAMKRVLEKQEGSEPETAWCCGRCRMPWVFRMVPLRLWVAVGVLGVLMGVGTAAYAALENWTPFDAWFFSVISLSTVGFGDLHPTTSSSRLFSVFYLLLGTLAFAAAMGQFVEVVAQRQMARKRAELLALEVTPQVIARLDEDGDGKVDRAEYISFMLLQLGHCTQEDLDQINARFHALDRDGTGLLDQNDLK